MSSPERNSSPDYAGLSLVLEEIRQSRNETRELIESHKTETKDLLTDHRKETNRLIEENTAETKGLRGEVADLTGEFIKLQQSQKGNERLWEARLDTVEKDFKNHKIEFIEHKTKFEKHANDESSIINMARGAVRATKLWYALGAVLLAGGAGTGAYAAGSSSSKPAPTPNHAYVQEVKVAASSPVYSAVSSAVPSVPVDASIK